MRNETFFETHIKSKLAVARILRETMIRVEIYVSDYEEWEDKLGFTRIKIIDRIKTSSALQKTAEMMEKNAHYNDFDINLK